MMALTLLNQPVTFNQPVTLPQALKIIAIKDENEKTKTITLAGQLNATPGQFVMVWLPGSEEKPFSLAGTNPLALTIAAVGPFSRTIHHLQVGDYVWIRGPLGQGYTLPQTEQTQETLLVGGGYGVAPLHFLATHLLERGFSVKMVIGARRAADLLLAEAFTKLNVPLWLTTEDGSVGIKGRVTDAMQTIFEQKGPDLVYTCGPTGMLAAIATLCQTKNIPYQLAWEAHMRCGIGLCGSCEVGAGWLTCLDGPVFAFNPLD